MKKCKSGANIVEKMKISSGSTLNASLVVVGSGIKFVSHLTTEARAYIEQSDKVLYLVNEPAMQEWIQRKNPNSESLAPLYTKYPLRLHCYQAITNYILEQVRKNQHVCVVLYGHPTVFAMPGLEAIKLARKEKYYAIALPGISAEDCLYADLLIDPGSVGCQTFEATDLLVHHRQIDNSCHLILWQAGAIGLLRHANTFDNSKGLGLLVQYLKKYYPVSHEITIYEAAQYPSFEAAINKVLLENLFEMKLSNIATLYIPPYRQVKCDNEILEILGINIDSFK
jgi:uncharacterized protein YabN with tetrapyrrole methylase and pyrophosphatase domain